MRLGGDNDHHGRHGQMIDDHLIDETLIQLPQRRPAQDVLRHPEVTQLDCDNLSKSNGECSFLVFFPPRAKHRGMVAKSRAIIIPFGNLLLMPMASVV